MDEKTPVGIIEHRQEGLFAIRLHVVAGDLSSSQLRKVADVAERYGRGQVHLTTRQDVEIPFVQRMYLGPAEEELGSAGIGMGSTGRRVRVVVACPGNATCKWGVVDTREMASRLDQRYFGRVMPHKFKVAISGCRNNCARVSENDIGIMGGVEPRWQKSECFNCGACVYVCPVGAITVVEDAYVVDRGRCINCGSCTSGCPNAALTAARRGYALWIGGTAGRWPRPATKIPGLMVKEEVIAMVERAVGYYLAKGRTDERLGRTLDRIGLESALPEIMESRNGQQ